MNTIHTVMHIKRIDEISESLEPVNGHKVFDLFNDPETSGYFKAGMSYDKKRVDAFNRWLKAHKNDYVRLYHGTGARHDILGKGILRTTLKRRNSYQSASGYVYLSVYPDHARMFGEMGNPYDKAKVYAVDVPIGDLRADADQLKNKRMWDSDLSDVGDTLADSLMYGSGARVRRDIKPYEITLL